MKKLVNKDIFEGYEIIDEPLDILRLANQGKSIYVTKWNRLSPAAFILSMQFRQVIKWMNEGTFLKKVEVPLKNLYNETT